ncbi:hypothetical protein GCM10009745_24470 [Kribbella yunnanensis]|uniref:Terminase n=1 Tax=Kribbella yunnanensis TaxID=190194 RepID=A0ABP4SZB9_9ACTN
MTRPRKPRPPADLQAPGKAFWSRTVSTFELTDSEVQLLRAVCRLLDEIELLEAAIDRDGVVVRGSTGQIRVHPAVAEARGHRVAAARLIAQLALPDQDDNTVLTALQARSRRANDTRWGKAVSNGQAS